MTPPHPDLTRLADEDLLTLVERGDSEAFEVLYDRHARVAYSLAFRLLGERTAAEDLVQEAFLAVWRLTAAYSAERGSVRTWLLAIVHNRGVDQLRRQSAMSRRQEALESVALVSGDAPDTADAAVDRALAGEVRKGLDGLPAEQEQVLSLAYFSGFTQQEIAEMLMVPLGTVKSRMRLGLERLRRGLGEPGGLPA
jgi:RNA polymerase sigma-70 factor (ECF subfamily)